MYLKVSIAYLIQFSYLNCFGYDIRRVVHKWFSLYLSNSFQYVDLNEQSSFLRLISFGVPQGGILCPILYALFVNDIFRVLNTSVHCILYADDTALCISLNDINFIMNNVSQLFAVFSRWFQTNLLALNDKVLFYGIPLLTHEVCSSIYIKL